VPAEPEPPRKTYGFKPKEFERVNAPRPADAADAAPPPAANDVFALQRELRAREIAAGLDELKPPARPRWRRRKRDYWTAMILVNALAAAVTLFSRGNVVVLVYAFAGAIILSGALTWVVWVLLDDY